jgi:hypothetical protein
MRNDSGFPEDFHRGGEKAGPRLLVELAVILLVTGGLFGLAAGIVLAVLTIR